jgi:hypothetical protein
MCFDPAPKSPQLYALLKRFCSAKLNDQTLNSYADLGVEDLQTAFLAAACLMREKVVPRITPAATNDSIKDCFWAYNGRSYGSIDKSPYVVNLIDKDHTSMLEIGTEPDMSQPGGRRLIRRIDRRPGAYVVYLQLIQGVAG